MKEILKLLQQYAEKHGGTAEYIPKSKNVQCDCLYLTIGGKTTGVAIQEFNHRHPWPDRAHQTRH